MNNFALICLMAAMLFAAPCYGSLIKNDNFAEEDAEWTILPPGFMDNVTLSGVLDMTGYAVEGNNVMYLSSDPATCFRYTQQVDMSQIEGMSHLSFQLAISLNDTLKTDRVVPTLFVSLGKTTLLTLPFYDLSKYDDWSLINIALPKKDWRTNYKGGANLTFQLFHRDPINVFIDTVRFVRYDKDVVEGEFTQEPASDECSPGCKKTTTGSSTYVPACDNVACGYSSNASTLVAAFPPLPPISKSELKGNCVNLRPPDIPLHVGMCTKYYNKSSCCASVYDESATIKRITAKIEDICPGLTNNTDSECGRELMSLVCSPCHPSAGWFMDDFGSPFICEKYAKKLKSLCKSACPSFTDDFLQSYGFGMVNDNGKECFNGEETGEFFLNDIEIACIAVACALVVIIVVLIVVLVLVKSHKYAKKVDDKYEPETCVVAPESTAGAPTQSVELQSVPASQPMNSSLQMQPMDSTNLAQTQQMMMMMNSGMMMPPAYSQAGMVPMDSTASMNASMNGLHAMDPSLSKTVVISDQ